MMQNPCDTCPIGLKDKCEAIPNKGALSSPYVACGPYAEYTGYLRGLGDREKAKAEGAWMVVGYIKEDARRGIGYNFELDKLALECSLWLDAQGVERP